MTGPGGGGASPLLDLAARLEALAGWLDESKAAGKPPKYLVAQAASAVREIAATARADAGPDDTVILPRIPSGGDDAGDRRVRPYVRPADDDGPRWLP